MTLSVLQSKKQGSPREKIMRRRSGKPEGRRSHSPDENPNSRHPRCAAKDRETSPIRWPLPWAAGFPVRERTDTAGSVQGSRNRWGGSHNRVFHQYAGNRQPGPRRDKRLRPGKYIVSWTGPSIELSWGPTVPPTQTLSTGDTVRR